MRRDGNPPDADVRRPDEEAEFRRVEELLRTLDPGRGAAPALSPKRRRSVLWSWRHPFLAWCMLHHRAIAFAVTAVSLALLLLWLLAMSRRADEENHPRPVSAPVVIGASAE